MRFLLSLVGRFSRDERGAFAMIFAVISIALIAMGGAAVDFTQLEQARTRAQVGLDAAALALQPTIYTTPDSIRARAQSLLIAQLSESGQVWNDCNIANKAPCASVISPGVDTANGQLTLTANIKVPTYFVSLVGVNDMPSQILSVATRKKLNLEVSLVLDNSGSMTTSFGSGTRMSVLKDAAKCAMNILFYPGIKACGQSVTGITPNPNVKMALVPFNDDVNVGSGNGTASWLNLAGGLGTFVNDNFDNDDYSTTPYTGGYPDTINRVKLFTQIKDKNGSPLKWSGCVEARINNGSTKQYDTDDTVPDTSDPDTLFTPLFAPDEPDSGGFGNSYISDTPAACNWTGTCSVAATTSTTTTKYTQATTSSVTRRTLYDYRGRVISGPTVTASSGPTATTIADAVATAAASTATFTATFGTQQTGAGICSCPSGTASGPAMAGQSSSAGPTTVTTQTVTSVTTSTGSSSDRTLQTTVDETTNTTTAVANATTTPTTITTSCSGQTYTPKNLPQRVLQERMCKYTAAAMTTSISFGFGPNADCPATAIQPLTTNPSALTTAVNNMVANGFTNIQEGTAWGFRVLSPTPPFTEGAPYDNATSKVMIVMTDGENTYDTGNNMNGADTYGAYAYPWDNYKNSTPKVSRGRLGDVGWSQAQFTTQINSRLTTTCANAKAAGITIYTIGLATDNTSNPTANKALLTACATLPAYAYFPNTADDLTNAFSNIANQLAALRLAQ